MKNKSKHVALWTATASALGGRGQNEQDNWGFWDATSGGTWGRWAAEPKQQKFWCAVFRCILHLALANRITDERNKQTFKCLMWKDFKIRDRNLSDTLNQPLLCISWFLETHGSNPWKVDMHCFLPEMYRARRASHSADLNLMVRLWQLWRIFTLITYHTRWTNLKTAPAISLL